MECFNALLEEEVASIHTFRKRERCGVGYWKEEGFVSGKKEKEKIKIYNFCRFLTDSK